MLYRTLRTVLVVLSVAFTVIACEPVLAPPVNDAKPAAEPSPPPEPPPTPESPPEPYSPEPPPEPQEPPEPLFPYESCEEALREPDICGCGSELDEHGNRVVTAVDSCFEPQFDERCPYNVKMAHGASGALYPQRLLAQVSAVGTLCSTGTHRVSPAALDKVSRMSTAMLQHRPDLVGYTLAPSLYTKPQGGDVIVLYAEDDDWCTSYPQIYTDYLCRRLTFQGGGKYFTPIILCPENELRVCVHEIAHAIYYAANRAGSVYPPDYTLNERQPVIDRFAEPDVVELWRGYALENDWEFFAEMSAMYFCTPTDRTNPAIVCGDQLQEYDPKTYAVLDAIYRGWSDLRPLAD